MKSNGLRTEPCGTPNMSATASEASAEVLKICPSREMGMKQLIDRIVNEMKAFRLPTSAGKRGCAGPVAKTLADVSRTWLCRAGGGNAGQCRKEVAAPGRWRKHRSTSVERGYIGPVAETLVDVSRTWLRRTGSKNADRRHLNLAAAGVDGRTCLRRADGGSAGRRLPDVAAPCRWRPRRLTSTGRGCGGCWGKRRPTSAERGCDRAGGGNAGRRLSDVATPGR